jgi:hypothetical protein
MDEKREPIIFSKESVDENLRFYRVSLCLKKL